jgi:hypothetical protein
MRYRQHDSYFRVKELMYILVMVRVIQDFRRNNITNIVHITLVKILYVNTQTVVVRQLDKK